MTTPPDSFAAKFDSIEIDRANAPSPDIIERALSMAGEEGPGFYLLDDAQGRFVIDRKTGLVALSDPGWLEREPGAVHFARLRVVEPSGARYEIALPLRLTGLVPLMVGAQELDCSAFSPDSHVAPLISLA